MGSIIPYVPDYITVHLGAPASNAGNVTVAFPDYIKNVASSEVYPTWEQSALRANILAQISFALNRIYTEFYPSRGYDYNITNSTANDQRFINGRNIFENISQLVDEIFNTYIRRQGNLEPLLASFCNGTTVTCDGLSQWGSQNLAQQGLNSVEILRRYYGDNIELVANAPVQGIQSSYPGEPLALGDRSWYVGWVQYQLNRISGSYPSIPNLTVDSIFGSLTQSAVIRFQEIFDLQPTGVVDLSTWYAIVRIYVAVTNLAELYSQGQALVGTSFAYPDAVSEGQTGLKVQQLQYMLAVVGAFIDALPILAVTSVFETDTFQAVQAFQRFAGLPETGVVNRDTWDTLYRWYIGVETQAPPARVNNQPGERYPGEPVGPGSSDFEEAAP